LLRIPAVQIGFYIFYGIILALFNSIWILSVATNGVAVATAWFLSPQSGTPLVTTQSIFTRLPDYKKKHLVPLVPSSCPSC